MNSTGFASRCLINLFFCTPVFAQILPVTTGSGNDYQPSVIRSTDDHAHMVVFERLDAQTSGDLWLTRSLDNGETWSAPSAIVASTANERHPALLQLGPASYVLFYLKGTGATTSFRLWRATSSDGITFSEQGVLDLGWASGGEINPHVIRQANGTLIMSYQRLSGGVYLAQSSDDGATWDLLRTAINSVGALPRIAYRESDGLYLASYQTGASALQMFVKTTTDVRNWTAAAQNFAATGNNHDSLPIVMPDDAFALFWIRANGQQFDIAVRRSLDGVTWSPALSVTSSIDADDVEPHPLIGTSSSSVELYWGRKSPLASGEYDIVRQERVIVDEHLFDDGFDE